MFRAMEYYHESGTMKLRNAVQQVEQFKNGDENMDSRLGIGLVQFSMVLQEAGSNAMKSCLKRDYSTNAKVKLLVLHQSSLQKV